MRLNVTLDGNTEIALSQLMGAIEADPGVAAYHSSRATICRRLGRLDDAEAGYRASLALQPDQVHIHNDFAVLLQERGRLDEAEERFRAALAIQPDFAEGQCNLGNLLADLGRREEAETWIKAAIGLRPDLPEAHNNLGNVLRELGRSSEAVAACREAIRLRPSYASAYSNLANALRDLDCLEEAEAAYRTALRIDPRYAVGHNNLATVLLETGRLDEAITEYRAAVALKPDYADAHNNLGIALLLDGDFTEGWRETEWRWRTKKNARLEQRFTQPLWDGEATGDKVILLYAEQGFGDTVQFCRYIPRIAARHRIAFEAQAPLVPLLASLSGIEYIVAQGDPLPEFDLRCPLLSVPRILGTTLENIPDETPYLKVDESRAIKWRERVAGLPGVKVGVVWAGNPDMAADGRRSISLAQLAPLGAVSGISFISLQKSGPTAEAAAPPTGLVLHDWTTELTDFGDTAALIDALDLVIGVDTAVVHVAGALGKPVWLLNRYDSCWRWLRDREESPWYPTLRQFRQDTPGNWKGVVAQAAAALTTHVLTAASKNVEIPVTIEMALQHHRSGRWSDAERAYQILLQRDPANADSQHLLGVLAFQRGEHARALNLIQLALQQRPTEGRYHGNLGLALKALGRRDEAEQAFRSAIALNPEQPEVLSNLGNLLNGDGRIADAERSYREALRLNPKFAVARDRLGELLLRSGRPVEAALQWEALVGLQPLDVSLRKKLSSLMRSLDRIGDAVLHLREALRLADEDAALRVDLGNLLKEGGRAAEAEAEYRRTLEQCPNMPSALINLSNLVKERGFIDEAEELCRAALRTLPSSAEAWNNLGLILKETRRAADAEVCYREAIRLRSDFPEPLNNLGDLLRGQNRLSESEHCCREAIRIRPHYAVAYSNLGNTLRLMGRLDEAEVSYRESIRLKPDFPFGFSNLGTVLLDLGRHAEAEHVLRQALSLAPDFADAHCNLGVALIELGQVDNAVRHYREALRIKSDYAEAHSNLGGVFLNRRDLTEAIAEFRAALRCKPNYPDAHNNLAIALLLLGEFTEGWIEYEWRWKLTKQLKRVRPFTQPLWAGEETGDNVLLLHAEQGFGDTVQFCRYVPLIAAAGCRVILEVQRPLVPLLTGLPGVHQVVAHGDPLPPFDLHCPLLSVPRVVGTTKETIPRRVPYLCADPAAVMQWRTRLAALPGKKIGLVWAGNAAMSADRRRSVELTRLARLADIPGASFVSLQKGPPAAQTASLPPNFIVHDWTAELGDFAATAALVEALDLVIGVDTSVIHLAGALGKPVWLLNRFDCCWRWKKEGDDSTWYPTLRQFRQRDPGAWNAPIADVLTALESFCASEASFEAVTARGNSHDEASTVISPSSRS